MLFNSIGFLFFFPIVTIAFFLLPHRFRWFWLLAASCFFYMFFKPIYIVILAFTIVVDYFAGIVIESAETQKKKHLFLLFSLIANIGVLGVFKYYNFFDANITGLFGLMGIKVNIPYLNILLPIGLSFHTFQAMSYTIEVYRGNQKAERHFGIYALYVMFFPQLVAGPIERPQNMLHQFHDQKKFDYGRVVSGLQRMLLGIFKKVVIADRLAIYVDAHFNSPSSSSSLGLLLASIFFAFQIYCDFSGYSDIAIGSARVMGFDLMENFNFPFSGRNLTDFWRRWHISLLTWFNDYLFTPFVINHRNWGKWAVVTGLLLTFSISGLWHGAAWTFIIWGFLHALGMVYEFLTKKKRVKLGKKLNPTVNAVLSYLITFAFVDFTFVFFRANSIQDAWYVLKSLTHLSRIFNLGELKSQFVLATGSYDSDLIISTLLVLVVVAFHGTSLYSYVASHFNQKPRYIRWGVYYGAIILILWLGVFDNRQFIYFQF